MSRLRRHLTALRPGTWGAGGVAGYYCVAAHEGVALYSASSVYSGLLFSSSFRRMMSARWHSQGGDCGSDSFLAEPEFLHRLDAAGPFLFGRLRYPVVNSKHFLRRALPKGTMWSMSSLLGSDTTVLVFEVYWCQFRLFRSAFLGYWKSLCPAK